MAAMPQTPPRRAWTPSSARSSKMVLPEPSTRVVQSAWCERTRRGAHTPPRASPVPTIFFGTPSAAEGAAVAQRSTSGVPIYECVTPVQVPTPDSDGSPGMGRAASPTPAAAQHRALVREALGDVSNLSPVAREPPGILPKVEITPKRSLRSPQERTPVQAVLHDWAAAKFSQDPLRHTPSQRHDGRSPNRVSPHLSPVRMHTPCAAPPVPISPAHRDVFSSPIAPPPVPTVRTSPAKAMRVPVDASRAPRRTPFSEHRTPAQRVPGFVPHASASPGKGATSLSMPAMRAARPEKHAERVPVHQRPGANENEERPRNARPARYTSLVPASRVGDSPEKTQAKRVRLNESANGRAPALHTSTSRVRAPEAKEIAPGPSRATAVTAPTPVSKPAPPQAPQAPPPASEPSSIAASRVPRTPRARLAPPPPPISAAELTRLTAKHTKQNEAYTVDLQTQVLRMPGARPPSPSQAFSVDAPPRVPHWSRAVLPETNERGEPIRHALGAGEAEEYTTPPHPTRGVRWDKRLVVSPTRAAPPQASCLAPRRLPLDAFGNVAHAGAAAGARRRTVTVKRLVYDQET